MILLDYNFGLPAELLRYSAASMDEVCDVGTRPEVIVLRWNGDYNPMCSCYKGYHLIRLSAGPDYWCQLSFQFAHEYCHHLIGGPLIVDFRGLTWFEECLCHTASLWMLKRLQNSPIWEEWGAASYPPKVQRYVEAMLRKTEVYLQSNPEAQDIRHVGDVLQGATEYIRPLYNVVAYLLLPLFDEHPQLWRIVGHIGNSCRWQSLEEFFVHLESVYKSDANAELSELRQLLGLR